MEKEGKKILLILGFLIFLTILLMFGYYQGQKDRTYIIPYETKVIQNNTVKLIDKECPVCNCQLPKDSCDKCISIIESGKQQEAKLIQYIN